MFALFYADRQELIATIDKGIRAVELACSYSRLTHRDVLVVYNGPEGETQLCCRFRQGVVEVLKGYCGLKSDCAKADRPIPIARGDLH